MNKPTIKIYKISPQNTYIFNVYQGMGVIWI